MISFETRPATPISVVPAQAQRVVSDGRRSVQELGQGHQGKRPRWPSGRRNDYVQFVEPNHAGDSGPLCGVGLLAGNDLLASLLWAGATQAQEAVPAAADDTAPPLVTGGLSNSGDMRLTADKSTVLTTSRPYKRVSVGPAGHRRRQQHRPQSHPGHRQETRLHPTDRLGRAGPLAAASTCIVSTDLQPLHEQLPAHVPRRARSRSLPSNNAVVLGGRVPSLSVAEQAAAVASPYVRQGPQLPGSRRRPTGHAPGRASPRSPARPPQRWA